MSTIKEQLAANIVGHWDFRKGTLLDQTSNSLDASFNSVPYWSNSSFGRVLNFDGVDDYLSISDNNLLSFGDGVSDSPFSISAWVKVRNTSGFWIFNKGDLNGGVGDAEYVFGTLTTGKLFFMLLDPNNGGFIGQETTGALDANEWLHLVATYDGSSSDTGIILYINTLLPRIDPLSGGSYTATDNKTKGAGIGRWDDGTGFTYSQGKKREVILWNIELSGAQVTSLYNESLEEAYTQDLAKRNFILPELATYSNFERDLDWTKGTGWSIAQGKASSDGTQTGDSDLTQNVGTIGETYTIRYEVSGYSAGNVTGLAGTAEGTDRSANGVYTDVVTAAGSGLLGLRADVDFVGSIDKIEIGRGYRLNYKNTFEDASVTVSAVGAGSTLNDFKVDSGTWSVTDDGTDKWLENATAGSACVPLVKGFGTWQFDFNKLTELGAGEFNINTLPGGGGDGYKITVTSSERLQLERVDAGVDANLFLTAAGYVANNTDYSLRLTRSDAGLFTLYIKGGAYTDWTTVDTATDTTYSLMNALCLTSVGTASIKFTNVLHWDGVVTPNDIP